MAEHPSTGGQAAQSLLGVAGVGIVIQEMEDPSLFLPNPPPPGLEAGVTVAGTEEAAAVGSAVATEAAVLDMALEFSAEIALAAAA